MSQAAAVALLTAVAGTVAYHLAQRRVQPGASPALVLLAAYLVGAAICAALLLTRYPARSARAEIDGSTLALGVSVVLIELGFLWMYRSGWTPTTGALAVNVLATITLAAVGAVAFGDRLTWPMGAGAALCLAGLALMGYRA